MAIEEIIEKEGAKKALTPIDLKRVMFGCDPEFFFKKDGKVIESEKVLSEKGLKKKSNQSFINEDGVYATKTVEVGKPLVIVDGIQAELNPLPDDCRANLAPKIASCFKLIQEKLEEDGELKADFSQTIEVPEEQFKDISDKAKKLGCGGSYNANGNEKSEIKINPDTYRKRSAGGHIHLGKGDRGGINIAIANALGNPEKLIPMLDIIVGNTCVLLDRDKGNIERRKVYGKAGEYRTPEHGIEYRVLSNFWLRGYPLMSLVMSLARVAVNIIATGGEHEKAFFDAVDMKDIEKAINENDFDLAMSNFKKIEPLLLQIVPKDYTILVHPITEHNIKQFKQFVKDGIDKHFTEDPMTHWCSKVPIDGFGIGWEGFVSQIEIKKEGKFRKTLDKKKELVSSSDSDSDMLI